VSQLPNNALERSVTGLAAGAAARSTRTLDVIAEEVAIVKLSAVVLLSLLALGNAGAATIPTEAEIRTFADGVMAQVAKGDLSGAFAAMKPYTIIPSAEFDAAALGSKSQRDQFGARYGKSIGYEFIALKRSGQSLIKLTYIEKTERHALPWMFYFYRSPKGWVLNSFQWNDRMPDLLAGQ